MTGRPRALSLAGLLGRMTDLRVRMLTAFALKGVAAVMSFALNWMIARRFGADGVGQFALALTTAVLTSTVAIAGLDTILVRTIAIEGGRGNTAEARAALNGIVRRVAAVALALGAGLFFGRDLIATHVAKEPQVATMIGVMAVCVPILAMSKLATAGLRGVNRVGVSQAIDGPLGTGLTALVFAVAVLTGLATTPIVPAVLYCACWALAASLGWAAFSQDVRRWGRHGRFGDKLYRAGLPVLCSALSLLFVDWFVMLQLSSSRTVVEAGLFRVAFQIVATLNLIITASDAILGPVIASSYSRGDKYRISKISKLAALAMLGVCSPILAAIFIAPVWLMQLFGPDFAAGATALQILAVGQAFNLLTGPSGAILVMTKHERWLLVYALVSAALAAGLALLLIPPYGVTGAAVAVAASVGFRNLMALALVRWVVGIKIFERKPQ